MNFLHFGMLPYFLPLVAIPILLHLLTLHRLTTVELSTFRFLFDSYVQQRRRMKFLEALIAFLRTLFILLLVLSIARPVVRHWSSLFGGNKSGRDVVLLIDGSASMNAVTDGITAFERSKHAALTVVDRLAVDDRVTLISVGAKPHEVCNRFSSDAEAIRNEIQNLKATPSRANLFAAFSQVFGPESRKLSHPIVYLFTDLQTGGWSEIKDGHSENLIPPETELYVINVGSNQEQPNMAMVGDAPEDQRAIAGLPIRLHPRVTNFSPSDTRDIPISIFIDDKEITRKILTVKPGESGEVEVIYTPTQPGVVRGHFEIPADRFPGDDQFLFTMNVAPQIKVLLVNGNPAIEPLANEGLYLRTAMIATEADPEDKRLIDDASQPDALKTLDKLTEAQQFVRSLAIEEIAESGVNAETLSGTDVVVLANCGALDQNHFKLLRQFVADGGGLLVFPGDRVNQDVYNKQFFPSPEIPEQLFIAAEFAAPVGDADKGDAFQKFGAIDFAHPVFAIFADNDQRYLTKVHVYRRFPITLPEAGGNSWPLMQFEDGSAALLESVYGNGRILVSAFPMHTKWSSLPMKPEFVPLVLRMISHVKRRADVDGPAVVPADGNAEFVVAQHWSPASGKVTDIAGRVTPVTFQRANSQLVGAFDRTVEQGFYDLEVKGGRAEQPEHGMLSFAVNIDAGESDFARLTHREIVDMFPGAKVTSVDASGEAQQIYGSVGDEREIWRPLIWLTFVIIVIEFLLATLGGHPSDGEQRSTVQRLRDLARGRWVGRMTGSNFNDIAESQVSQTKA